MIEVGPDLLKLSWRTGRHVGRTVYARLGAEASDDDVLIGLMDSPDLAAEACEAHNRGLEVVAPANPGPVSS